MRQGRNILGVLFLVATLSGAVGQIRAAEEESLGEKIKKFFQPTPTPTPRKYRKRSTKKATPSLSPTVPPKRKKTSPAPSSSPTASPKRKKTTPTPRPTASPKSKRKKTSPSPTPSASATATPEATPTPTEPPTPTSTPSPSPTEKAKTTVSISPNEIADYDDYPAPVRTIIDSALELTKQDLEYKYGSADPASGGMDCSGFVYYVLRKNGIADVPRDSSQQYVWVRKAGNFRAVVSRKADSFELDALKPGDLLFWTGTYNIDRDPPVTHAMIYLGREKGSKKRVMVGASDGRTYDDKQRFGVSVFDFQLAKPPPGGDASRSPVFVGYGRIPGLSNQ